MSSELYCLISTKEPPTLFSPIISPLIFTIFVLTYRISVMLVLPHTHQAKISYHPQNENFVHFSRIYCLGITLSFSLMVMWLCPQECHLFHLCFAKNSVMQRYTYISFSFFENPCPSSSSTMYSTSTSFSCSARKI